MHADGLLFKKIRAYCMKVNPKTQANRKNYSNKLFKNCTHKSGQSYEATSELDHQSLIGVYAHNCAKPMVARTPHMSLSLQSIAHIREGYWSAQVCRRHLFVTPCAVTTADF
jgi:hypothetical protein